MDGVLLGADMRGTCHAIDAETFEACCGYSGDLSVPHGEPGEPSGFEGSLRWCPPCGRVVYGAALRPLGELDEVT